MVTRPGLTSHHTLYSPVQPSPAREDVQLELPGSETEGEAERSQPDWSDGAGVLCLPQPGEEYQQSGQSASLRQHQGTEKKENINQHPHFFSLHFM